MIASAINGSSILAQLAAWGPATQEELLLRLGLQMAYLDRKVLARFAELLHLLEAAGSVVSQVGDETGALRYAVVNEMRIRLCDEDRELLRSLGRAESGTVHGDKQ
jgi:hypothetical protein